MTDEVSQGPCEDSYNRMLRTPTVLRAYIADLEKYAVLWRKRHKPLVSQTGRSMTRRHPCAVISGDGDA